MKKFRIQLRNTEDENPPKVFILQGISQKEVEFEALAKCIKYFRSTYITIRTENFIDYKIWYRNEKVIGYLTITKGEH